MSEVGTNSPGLKGDGRLEHGEEIAELHRRYRAPLLAYFSKRLRGSADADDLVQEVFVRLARRGDIGNVRQLEGYIFQTAANILRDRARRHSTRREDDHVAFIEEIHGSEDLSPERVLLGREAAKELLSVLRELPPRTRAIFVLRRLEGYRYAEIAGRLGISVSSVEKHMAKALAHIAKRSDRI